MLRRKIIKSEPSKETNEMSRLKKSSDNQEEMNSDVKHENKNSINESSSTIDAHSLDFNELSVWLIKNIISKEVINNLRNNATLPISNVDDSSTEGQWLEMALKSYISKDDLLKMFVNINTLNKDSLKYKELYNTAQNNIEDMQNRLSNSEDSLSNEKNKVFKLNEKLEQSIDLNKFVEFNFENVQGSERIKSILDEAIKSDSDNLSDFIVPFSINSQNIILLKKYIHHDFDKDIQMYQDEIRILLKSISDKYIPQRKELLEELAKIISLNFEKIDFISPEEYTYVEPSIHNIPNGGGQRVLEGKSFAIVTKETKQTMIYADIVAE